MPEQEIHRNSSLRKVYLNHEENGSWNYQNSTLVKKKSIGNAKWVSFIEPFFLTGFISPTRGNMDIGIAEIKPPVKGEKNSKRPDLPPNILKEMGVEISIPTTQLQAGYTTGYYFGPNTPEALAAVDQHYKNSKLNFKDNYYYGPRGFASINKYILYPALTISSKRLANLLPHYFFCFYSSRCFLSFCLQILHCHDPAKGSKALC